MDAMNLLFFCQRIHYIWAIPLKNLADDRLKKSNELLLGIKLLKLCGWEQMYCKVIEAIRKLEMVFISYPYLTGLPLQPNSTFAALSFMNLLIEPMYFVPIVTSLLVNGLIGFRRLENFLKAPETENSDGQWNEELQQQIKENHTCNRSGQIKQCSESTPLLGTPSCVDKHDHNILPVLTNQSGFNTEKSHLYAIKIDNGSFSWDDNSRPVLNDINLTIPEGKITMIMGTVGSGKSSLLSAILSEMTTVRGSVSFGGKRASNVPSIAYAAQKAWLVNASLKDNILFGQPYDEQRYKKVIVASALEPDLAILPGGDMIEIGEKGINLSGGQKQRVSVARAMYSSKDIVLLDDPLSALDVNVGKHLFMKGIIGRLRKSRRTIVLVTHQLQYLQQADKIILMNDGHIVLQGTFEDIVQDNPNVFEKWRQDMQNETDSDMSTSFSEAEADLDSQQRTRLRRRRHDIASTHDKEKGALVEDEELPRGAVDLGVYIYYARNMGIVWAFAFLFLCMIFMSFNISRDIWLSKWSEAGLYNSTVSDVNDEYLAVYVYLGCGCIVMAFLFPLAGVIAAWFAAKRLHFNMLRNVMAAPMRFFDTTPVGRILNRFASDTQIIDTKLIIALMGLNYFLWTLLFAFIINSIISPVFILEIIPVLVIYSMIALYFIRTSRELQRLDSVTKSPVFSHFSETLSGLATIRAYREQSRFFLKLLEYIDTNNAAFLYLKASFGWLGLQLSLCGAVVVLMVGVTTLVQSTNGVLAPSEVGLAISYVLMIAITMYDFVQAVTETEMQMNPVERVQYYAMVPTENYRGSEPPPGWPSRGAIEIDNISVRYAEKLPAVLKDVTMFVQAGEKVGICGRTGSGKSSLALAFFRLIQTFKGKIVIDGEDIGGLSLTSLRQRLSIIPQDPVLFNGTIRSNLDPEGRRSDQELWHALEIAQLQQVVSQYGNGLDALVSEGGDNFSAGQRQLFSLARAFLRNSRVLIMDEATASVDYETERVLQNVVSTAFKTKTVLTIAHRVATILQSDTIWVLNEGKVVECGSPEQLLRRPESMFYGMVQANK
ncbi:ATP-binding cassette sub-family C member 9-like [Amphiura filiformis]|uniref:ATP-binding cassette sub-family C member 9-like n=1 Tax=Amphiura filiformis TaxID=82378 RepID=UPI003B2112A9